MKTILLKLILAAAVISISPAQTTESQAVPGKVAAKPAEAELPKFDLDFPGGTPHQLVQMIQDQIGILNVIIPNEHKDEKLPALRMRNVSVKQLFEALALASQKTVMDDKPSGFPPRQVTTAIGFRASGPIEPETVWFFYVQKPQEPPKSRVVRYYQLNHYLTKYKVDDITTAIQAGWKMLGQTEKPELNYHEDTKLLIAVGENQNLLIIDSVLQELGKGLAHPPAVTVGQPFARPGSSPQ